jgi:hypothetical protein
MMFWKKPHGEQAYSESQILTSQMFSAFRDSDYRKIARIARKLKKIGYSWNFSRALGAYGQTENK